METTRRNGTIDITDEGRGTHPAEAAAVGERASWLNLLKGYAAVHVARSADRVLERRAEARAHPPVAGRRGGEVRAAAMPAPRAGAPGAGMLDLTRREAGEGAAKEGQDPYSACAEDHPEGAWPIAKATFKEFSRDNCMLMAAAVAFYLFMSLIPLIVVGIAIAAYFLSTDDAAKAQVMGFVSQFVAAGEVPVRQAVEDVIAARGRIGGVGLLTLMFTATAGFATLENAINVIWGAPNRNFIKSKLFALGMLLVIGLLFLLSFAITFAASMLTTWAHLVPGLGQFADSWGLKILGFLLPVIISGLMFTAIFKWFPNVKVDWKPALIAGFVTAVLWEIFKIGYTWYSNSQLANQEATYGALGSLVGLILWILYSSALVLLGSELAWVLTGCPRGESKHPAKAGNAA